MLNTVSVLQEKTEQAITIIEIGNVVLSSEIIIDDEKTLIRERLERLESSYEYVTHKIVNRKKKLSQAVEFYSLFEKVCCCFELKN